MKALVMYEKRDGCTEIRDVPVPEVGPDDVLIRVMAAAVCGSDIERYHCQNVNIKPPMTVGHEFCGVVDRVGDRVTRWKPGDRVVSDNTGHVCGECHACGAGRFLNCPERIMLGGKLDGGFAEFVRIPGDVLRVFPKSLRRLPDNLAWEEGAVLEPSVNAYYAVVQEGQLQVGHNVVIFGPGTIGLFAVEWAKMGGASNIVLIGGSDNRLELGKRLGASHLINYRRTDSVPGAIEQAIGRNQADLLLDIAGGDNIIPDSIAVARPAARIVKVAWTRPQLLDLNPGMRKGVEIIGHLGYDAVSWDRVLRVAGQGRIDFRPFTGVTFKLDDWQEAYRGMEEKRHLKSIFNSFA